MGIKSLGFAEVNRRANKLREIAEHYHPKQSFAIDSNAEAFLKTNPLAPIIGTICDQWVGAEFAWEFPYWLCEELNREEFCAEAISKLGQPRIKALLETYMDDKWPSGMSVDDRQKYLLDIPKYIADACTLIVNSFGNNPDNMFIEGSYNVPQAYFILRALPGIGAKKASMIARDFAQASGSWFWGLRDRLKKLSNTDFTVGMKHLSEVPVDIHVVKVFCRTMGESRRTPRREDFLNYWPDIQNLAKLAFPDFPGKLDEILWTVGREYCDDRQPNCNECPLQALPCDYSSG